MNALDYAVLLIAILGIACYGIWRSRDQRTLDSYLRSSKDGLVYDRPFRHGHPGQRRHVSVHARPGLRGGLGFVQIYFGLPIALVVIAIFFLPIYRRLNVYTAYEYLGRRFDEKTRLLGAAIFLLQRGWRRHHHLCPGDCLLYRFGLATRRDDHRSGFVVIAYTTLGGSEAVNVTQKYQIGVIFAGMIAACRVVEQAAGRTHSKRRPYVGRRISQTASCRLLF